MSTDRSPKKNRLQAAREEYEARAALPLIDLVDGSFHRAGFRFPTDILQREFERYLAGPGYRPVAAGDPAARAAIAAYYSGDRGGAAGGGDVGAGGSIGPDDIILTASSSESYRLLFDHLCEAGDSVLLPCPGYPLFEHLAEHSRVGVEFYDLQPENAWLPDPARLEALMVSRPRVRALVLISPNNPSGAVIDASRLAAIRAAAGRQGLVVILDEVFREFVYEAPQQTGAGATGSVGRTPNPAAASADPAGGSADPAGALLVRINGISKMFACPDMKLGWMAVEAGTDARLSREALLQRLEFAADVYLSASGPAQHLVPALFAEGMGFVTEMRAELSRRREVMLEELAAAGGLTCVRPAGGIHCIVEVPGLPLDDEELAVRAVREEGLYVHPGYLYGIQERTAIVLSFLSHPERIREGVARLRQLLRRL